ncbi:hypothetical protein EV421DRAFT_1848076 [Armillaria borealis]|uniref:Uncharacterized protein n=1 Tax=Armillaria borealis TaxID=47425 RepID=A0AA39IZF7_9AGAR|nr:hypothetical protein EV421DRAFT_1848076 [Armillaria borealis]
MGILYAAFSVFTDSIGLSKFTLLVSPQLRFRYIRHHSDPCHGERSHSTCLGYYRQKENFITGFSSLLFLNVAATLAVNLSNNGWSLTLRFYNWFPMLLFELIVFLTAVFYGVRGVKETKILTQVRQNFGPKPIMGLLLRDSAFYFVIVLCCFPILAFVDHEMGLSLMSVTITRMLLRLRKRAKADLNMPHTQDMELESFRVANPVDEVSTASDA